MNIEERKLEVIDFIIKQNDETIISKIENTIIEYQDQQPSLKEFSKEELIKRAIMSFEDYKNNKVISQTELELQAENW